MASMVVELEGCQPAVLPAVGSFAEDPGSSFPWPSHLVSLLFGLSNFLPYLGFSFLIYRTKWPWLDDL